MMSSSTITLPRPIERPTPQGFHAQFELGRFLGLGTAGRVYAATSKLTGEGVAVKIIPKSALGGRMQKSALNREVGQGAKC
jgi:serine/threonine protein kinase